MSQVAMDDEDVNVKRQKVEPGATATMELDSDSNVLAPAACSTSSSSSPSSDPVPDPAPDPAADPTPNSGEPGWPPSRIPIELFDLIASFLPRRSIQDMRLVNREFEEKVSAGYFRNVVATFRPDIYGYINDDFNHFDVAKESLIKEQSVIKTGLRIFQQFGTSIKAFALSLELNEAELVDPPIKLNQEVVRTSWGLYRWPVENYARYSNLENLEETADETQRMTRAFAKLTELSQFGLSCDSGLGFLTPPTAHKTRSRVFESSRYDPEPVAEKVPVVSEMEPGRSARYINLKRMVAKAGYAEAETHEAIKLLLECEGKSLTWTDIPYEEYGLASLLQLDRAQDVTPEGGGPLNPAAYALPQSAGFGLAARLVHSSFAQYGDLALSRRQLEPRALTTPQREMLLEMKWALDALTQSYVISVIDNKDIFSKITILSFAKIPSNILHILSRNELWSTFRAVKNFRLGVIPDWRSLEKSSSDGSIEEDRPSPLDAMTPVFELLKTHIAPMEHLTSLHFEWHCGGESGDGLGQRNRYILPAPFVPLASRIVDNNATALSPPAFLALPHIQRLSLKNCWFSPAMFLRVVKHMVGKSLTDLQLESVSLSGPPPGLGGNEHLLRRGAETVHWPWPLCLGQVVPGQMFSHPRMGQGGANAANNPAAQNAGLPPAGHWANWGGPPAVLAPNAAIPAAPITQQQQMAAAVIAAGGGGGAAGGPLAPGAAAGPGNINALNLHLTPGNPPPVAGPVGPVGPVGPGAAATPSLPTPAAAAPVPPYAVMQPSALAWAGVPSRPSVPRFLSWPHVINELTPRRTILEQYEGIATEDDHKEFSEKLDKALNAIGVQLRNSKKGLEKLSFTSCGYVLVDHSQIDSWKILPTQPFRANFADDINEQLHLLDKTMQIAIEPFLARIVDHLQDEEKQILHGHFGLVIPGYTTRYDSNQVDPGQYRDGFILHGTGRFNGTIGREAQDGAIGRK